MSCNTSSSYTLNFPWVAPGVNETPGTTRTFVQWTTVLGISGSVLCQYMLDYPGWFTEFGVITPSGFVISFRGYGIGALARQGAVVAQASDYYTDQIDVSPSTTIPGANLHAQLEWLKLNALGSQSWLDVVDTILSAPPGSPPAAGYRILVTAGATGLFAGQDHNIAISNGLGAYSFEATNNGDSVCALPNPGRVYQKVAGAFAMYSYGNWQAKASAADTTPGWLFDKLDIPGFAKAIINPGANEIVRFTPSGGGGGGGSFPVSVYRDTLGTLVIPGSGVWVDVPFGTADLTSAAVNQSGVNFIFQEAGSFFVGVEVTVASGFSRTKQAARVVMSTDLGVSYFPVPYMETEVFTTNTYNDEQTIVIGSRPIVAAVNDRIKVQVMCSSGTLDANLAGSKTNIVLWKVITAGGGGGGVTDHGALTGLGDDDHTQYHTDGRGDARYPQLSASYSNPAWITALAWAKLTGVPATFAPSAHTHPVADVSDMSANARTFNQAANYAAMRTALGLGSAAVEGVSQTSAANRVVQALGTGKIDTSFLPDSVLGQLEYQGTWAAATNGPAIPAASTANKGWFYVASNSVAAGHGYANIPNIAYDTGDWIVSNGTSWDKVDNTDAVSTVFGRLGAIVAANGDYNAGQITNTPAGNIAAVTVQAALNELDSEKQPLSSVLTTLAGASVNGQSLVTAANYASMRTLLGLGTAAQVNTGTGAGDVPTITQADLRYAALVHTHVIANVTGLQTALDAKQKTITSGTAAPSGGVDGDIYLQYT